MGIIVSEQKGEEMGKKVPQVYKESTLRKSVCYFGENSCVLKM